MSKRILLITSNSGLSKVFNHPSFAEFELVDICQDNSLAVSDIRNNSPVDIVMMTTMDGLVSTKETALEIKKLFPNIRIVYFAGIIDDDPAAEAILKDLAMAGIYDLVPGGELTRSKILNVLETPMTSDDVQRYIDISESGEPDEYFPGYPNVIVCASVKPGSGKSLLAVNLATAIAKYGKAKEDGNKPRVALIDGDFSNQSIGMMTNRYSTKFNLKEALKHTVDIIDEDGAYIGTDGQIAEAKRYVRKCFIKDPQIENLYELVGSDFSISDLEEATASRFYFVIESVVDAFDVVIVDSNSALEHRTTMPLYELAGKCYFVIDPDYNNIQNNIRYKEELDSLGVGEKCRYVLNKDVKDQESLIDLQYDPEESLKVLKVNRKIPMIDRDTLEEKIYKHETIVEDLTPDFFSAKQAMLDVANEIWNIDYDEVNKEFSETQTVVKKETKKKKGLFKI